MAEEEWVTDQIEVTVSGFLTTRHSMQVGTDVLAGFTLHAFRRTGELLLANGRELTVKQTSIWKGTHEMREGGVLLGHAQTRGVFKREVDIEFGDQQYVLIPGSLWKRNWVLVDAQGIELLDLRPRGAFRRGALLTVLAEVEIDLLAFAYYLVHKRWEAESAAASGAASAT